MWKTISDSSDVSQKAQYSSQQLGERCQDTDDLEFSTLRSAYPTNCQQNKFNMHEPIRLSSGFSVSHNYIVGKISRSSNETMDEETDESSAPYNLKQNTEQSHLNVRTPIPNLSVQKIESLYTVQHPCRQSSQLQPNISCDERTQPSQPTLYNIHQKKSHSLVTSMISDARCFSQIDLQSSAGPIQPSISHNSGASNDNMENFPSQSPSLKRSSKENGTFRASKALKTSLTCRRGTKDKLAKSGTIKKSAKERLCDYLWMRIFELTDPRFLNTKARLICRRFKEMIDNRKSIFVNQRVETYGLDMPGPPPGITERQYNNLLGGKGCEECSDRACTAAKWPWFKRWCVPCWEKKIIREDKVVKKYQNDFTRGVILQILKCLPYCMHDSYMKPHDVSEGRENRPPGGPKIYKFFQIQDVANIVAAYESLTPKPHIDALEHSLEERTSAIATYQALLSKLDEKRQQFFAEKKKENDRLMERVCKIENGIRKRRREIALPNKIAREGRREYHTKMAKIELPHIPIDFIQKGKAYKASCRIYRNSGTERTWKALKPKIEKEWEQEQDKRACIITVAAAGPSQAVNKNISTNSSRNHSQSCSSVPGSSLPSPGAKDCIRSRPDFPYLGYIVTAGLQDSQAASNLQKSQPSRNAARISRSTPHRSSCIETDCRPLQNQRNYNISQLAPDFTVDRTNSILNGIAPEHEPDTVCEQPVYNTCESIFWNSLHHNTCHQTAPKANISYTISHQDPLNRAVWHPSHENSVDYSFVPITNGITNIPVSSLLNGNPPIFSTKDDSQIK